MSGKRLHRAGKTAFSLLEVMIAIAILGLALTAILSAQGGLAASNRTGRHTAIATALGRCKMTEVEEDLLKRGYSETDVTEEGRPCCDGADRDDFSCDWKVLRVELPNPPLSSPDGGSLSLGGALFGGDGGAPGIGSGPLDLNPDAGIAGLGAALQGQQGGAGMTGMLDMVFGLVYPGLKPVFEASIRRVTVTVRWKEGTLAREFELTQFVTNPQRAGLAAGALDPDGGLPGFPGASGATNGTGGTNASPLNGVTPSPLGGR
jgi:general secretion pathway protein I